MKTNRYLKGTSRILIIMFVLFFNINMQLASAFPFLGFEKGDPVPDVNLQPLVKDQSDVTFSSLKGEPFIVVFWGADLPEKIENSARILAEVESLTPFLEERNIQRFSVNVQNDDLAAINEVAKKSRSSIDIFLDENKVAYKKLGIFVMPTVLLIDKDGNVSEGLGYSSDLIDRLKGSVEVMLGEKTAEQVAAEQLQETIIASSEES